VQAPADRRIVERFPDRAAEHEVLWIDEPPAVSEARQLGGGRRSERDDGGPGVGGRPRERSLRLKPFR